MADPLDVRRAVADLHRAVAIWQRAGVELERLRIQELRALTEAQAAAVADALWRFAAETSATYAPAGLNPVSAAAMEVQAFCAERRWAFCFVGGVAVARWGEPRFTKDVDLTVVTAFGDEEPVIETLLERFAARVDDPVAFAVRNRVLLLRAGNGVPIDVALGASPCERRCVQRATHFDLGGGNAVLTCGAEDLIVLKAFAGRTLDWGDIERIAARQADTLDVALIWRELPPLLEAKGDAESAARLRRILESANGATD